MTLPKQDAVKDNLFHGILPYKVTYKHESIHLNQSNMRPIASTDNIIFPPGEPVTEIDPIINSGYIQFSPSFDQPLPTLVQAEYKGGFIFVTAVVLINTTLEEPTLIVNQLFTISNDGEPKLQFFIYCDVEEIGNINENLTADNIYNAFTINFKTELTDGFPMRIQEGGYERIPLKNVKYVETFLWNIDPKTSRGTVTTVQTTN